MNFKYIIPFLLAQRTIRACLRIKQNPTLLPSALVTYLQSVQRIQHYVMWRLEVYSRNGCCRLDRQLTPANETFPDKKKYSRIDEAKGKRDNPRSFPFHSIPWTLRRLVRPTPIQLPSHCSKKAAGKFFIFEIITNFYKKCRKNRPKIRITKHKVFNQREQLRALVVEKV